MTRQTWDLLSTLLYGRPGKELPNYVARRAAEIDAYLRDMRLPADSPIVIAHAEGILAIYRQEQRDAEQWVAIQQTLDGMAARLDRIERRLAPPVQATPSVPAHPQAPSRSRPSHGASGTVIVEQPPPERLLRRIWRAVKDWFMTP